MSPAEHPETYLDHNASAPLLPAAREALVAALALGPGNPMSAHAAGRRLRQVLEDARERVAELVGARPSEVIFTSGASEANALAIRGWMEADGGALVTSRAEHPSSASVAERIAAEGREVRWAGVDRDGRVKASEIVALARGGARLVSLLLAEPVTGALQPVDEVGAALAGGPTALHVDAAQAAGRVVVDMAGLGATLLSLSGHKIGGPAGIGALVVRDGAPFRNPLADGTHELGRRAGTQAVALAAGFGAAAVAARDVEGRARAMRARVDELRRGLGALGDVTILTPSRRALPNTCLFGFPGCPGDALLASLDALGVRVSTGSACTSGARVPPAVLLAGGWPADRAAEAIRVSVGPATESHEIGVLLRALRGVVPRVRAALATG